ncbi:MAG: membrane protein insertion efficiency factor YidD [Candidatus Magasanikbacteria bacterium RIFCSPLOWO2_02_FULL_44_11]|uniref:Putative membrane protein insertion efficiency factor n=1 Tax=Candidatus Magasanikbacteria bacterium RIFCSPLOWO2_02_FULL_44_11 TaxID=1798689 RepID=A0A1F6NA53_9BACT|nr:MAG: membrane protein insertion efficiency factor YidD [Candidatus Magasanikbacteria bacterium RIFCSPLOWO2_02_FULL_44_11]
MVFYRLKTTIFFLLAQPRKPVIWLIKAYQKTLSPDHGWLKRFYPQGYCRFYPSCSQYAYEIIKKRGLLIGVPLAIWRIMRCNPWNKGGIDHP